MRLLRSCALALSIAALPAGAQDVPAAVAGEWVGCIRAANAFFEREVLPAALVIAPDASVRGTVGGATLVDAHLRANRGWLGRALNLKTDWIIRARLDGPIDAARGVTRQRVSIPFDVVGDSLTGAVHTEGRTFATDAAHAPITLFGAWARPPRAPCPARRE